MPTVAQRQRQQRAATAAALAAQQQPKRSGPAATSRAAQMSAAASRSSALDDKFESLSDDDAAFSENDSDAHDVAAFEMDGQDIWTQNYCATCDCLIEPGQGVNARSAAERRKSKQGAQDTPQQASGSTSATATAVQSPVDEFSRSPQSSLRSKAGTIKARPPSSEGQASANTSTSSKFKRTNSAGRLHAVGAGGFGQGKRNGSAGSRLNALSELRPTTKLYSDASGKGKGSDKTDASRKSAPSLKRQSSSASTKSSTHSGPTSVSRPSSPVSPNSTLPRTKKGGMLGALTPAALKQQEELENAKLRAPGALYCSERCRDIDEQKSHDLGELVQYMQRPVSPVSYWSGPGSYGATSTRASVGSSSSRQPAYRLSDYTPGSDCMCQDCLEKNSVAGTVPSGASDTTESSVGYKYAARDYNKQRTRSGRLLTPQNLHSPQVGNWQLDYFGPQESLASRTEKTTRRRVSGTAQNETASQAGTDGSMRSDESEMWDATREYGGQQLRTKHYTDRSDVVGSFDNHHKLDITGAGTATSPDETLAGTLRVSRDMPSRAPSTSMYSDDEAHATVSPLRLLRQGNHHTSPSVDVSNEYATSPHPPSSGFLSRSVASERTENGASSGVTLAPQAPAPTASFSERRSLTNNTRRPTVSGISAEEYARLSGERYTDSPCPLDPSASVHQSAALNTLKSAASQTGAAAPVTKSAPPPGEGIDARRVSLAPSQASTTSNTSGNSWLRSSISSAWNSLRGLSSSDALEAQNEHRASVPSLRVMGVEGESGGPTTPEIESSPRLEQANDDQMTESLVHRPTIKRGKVPSFAHEIGRGAIPGDARGVAQPDSAGLPKSMASMQEAVIDEEKRRRRQERERAARHQRSKDVTQLPPLLGIAQPSSSSSNSLATARTVRNASSASLASMGSYGVSLSSQPDVQQIMRPTTPGLSRKAPHSQSGTSLHDYGTSPGRISTISTFGTSPRRAGLGWGVMTPIAQTPMEGPHLHRHNHHHIHQHVAHRPGKHQHHHSVHGHVHPSHGAMTRHATTSHVGQQAKHRSHGGPVLTVPLGHVGMLGMHPHGHAHIYGRHATTPVRMSTPSVPEDGGEMSSAALKGQPAEDEDESSDEEEERRRSMSSMASVQALSHSFTKRVNLDPLPAPQRPRSGMSMRSGPSMDHIAPPVRPVSRSQVVKHERAGSNDHHATKMYPVLDVPNREPTHDRYGLGWGHAESAGIEDLLPRRAPQSMQSTQSSSQGTPQATKNFVEQQPQVQPQDTRPPPSDAQKVLAQVAKHHAGASRNEPAGLSRKRLFYFDTS